MFDLNKIIDDYESGMSIREIAESLNTYPNKIARMITKSGYQLRSKEQAGKIAFDQGKITPPMLGKKRTKEEKNNISLKRSQKWSEVSDSDRESFRQNAKERWESQSPEQKIERQRRAGEALRKASTEGSKAEKFLYEELTRAGYDVIIHKVGLISGEKFEVDLYIPSMRTAIEIDGPQHFLPVYGEEALHRNIKYDAVKNGALLSKGFCVIRVKYVLKHCSLRTNNKLCELIKSELTKISNKFPDQQDRLIELEINNE
jgi:very-short-patch-repair endonuclease